MPFKPLVLGIDLDSTICDLITEWLRLYNEEYEAGMTIDQVKEWSMADNVPIGKEVYKYLADPGLYCRLDPFPGAIDAVRRFHEKGHEVHIISAPTPGMEHTAADKLWWCKQHLPFLPYDRITLMHAKERFLCDILIDDAPGNIKAHTEVQPDSLRIGIAYPYNECVSDLFDLRADSFEDPSKAWTDIESFIDRVSSSEE